MTLILGLSSFTELCIFMYLERLLTIPAVIGGGWGINVFDLFYVRLISIYGFEDNRCRWCAFTKVITGNTL
jgi:hypothetical protein